MNKSPRPNNAVRFGYEPRHDILNDLRPLSQYEMDWIPPDKFVIESYVKRECCIEIDVGIDMGLPQYRFIFRHIPKGHMDCVPVAGRIGDPSGVKGIGLNADPKGQLVLIGSGNAAYVSQAVVAADMALPSWVWLKAAQNRMELRRDVFGLPAAFAAQHTVKVGRVFSERKVSPLARQFSLEKNIDPLSAVQAGLVERISQTLDGIRSDSAQFPGEGLSQDNLVDLLQGIRIELNDNGVYRLVVGESIASLPKVLSLRLGPID